MRNFPVPIQIDDEEKIFGGHLSFRQMTYTFLLGPFIGGLLAFICPGKVFKAIFLLLVWGLFAAMAFINVQEMSLDKYLFLYYKWRKSPRVYTWKGGR